MGPVRLLRLPLTVLLQAILANTPGLERPGRQVVIADKAYYGKSFEAGLDEVRIDLL